MNAMILSKKKEFLILFLVPNNVEICGFLVDNVDMK